MHSFSSYALSDTTRHDILSKLKKDLDYMRYYGVVKNMRDRFRHFDGYTIYAQNNHQKQALLQGVSELYEGFTAAVRAPPGTVPSISEEVVERFIETVANGQDALMSIGVHSDGSIRDEFSGKLEEVWVDLAIAKKDLETSNEKSVYKKKPSTSSMTSSMSMSMSQTFPSSMGDTITTIASQMSQENQTLLSSDVDFTSFPSTPTVQNVEEPLSNESELDDQIQCKNCGFLNDRSCGSQCSNCFEQIDELTMPSQQPLPQRSLAQRPSPQQTPLAQTAQTPLAQASEPTLEKWTCKKCSLENTVDTQYCDACSTKRSIYTAETEIAINHIKNVLQIECNPQKILIYSHYTYGMAAEFENTSLKDVERHLDLSGVVNVRKKAKTMWTDLKGQATNFSKTEVIEALIQNKASEEKAAERCVTNRKRWIQQVQKSGHPELQAILAHVKANGLEDENKLFFNKNKRVFEEISKSTVKSIEQCVSDKAIDQKHSMLMLRIEMNLKEKESKILLELVNDDTIKESNHDFQTLVKACKTYGSAESAINSLCMECSICMCTYNRDEMEALMCTCHICTECFVGWITQSVQNSDPPFWTCPIEDSHAMDQRSSDEVMSYNYTFLQQRSEALKSKIEKEVLDLMQKKIVWNTLCMQPTFCWCANKKCINGFLTDHDDNNPVLRVRCPACNVDMCRMCKKPWEAFHDQRSCEEFEAYKLDNDPDIAKYLQDVGIRCPKCSMRFEVARGGCIHFKCGKCRHEFCAGCSKAFLHGDKCGIFDDCKGKGFHCHHPRNCLYFLRDESVETLEKMLATKNAEFQPKVLNNATKCDLDVTDDNMQTLKCNGKVLKFDLCEKHCKEYLVRQINVSNADPVDIFTTDEITTILARDKKAVQRAPTDTEPAYHAKMVAYVKANLPLPKLQ